MIAAQKNSRPAATSFIGVLRRAAFVAPNSFYQVLYVQVLEAPFAKKQAEITVVGRFGQLKSVRPIASLATGRRAPVLAISFVPSTTRK